MGPESEFVKNSLLYHSAVVNPKHVLRFLGAKKPSQGIYTGLAVTLNPVFVCSHAQAYKKWALEADWKA